MSIFGRSSETDSNELANDSTAKVIEQILGEFNAEAEVLEKVESYRYIRYVVRVGEGVRLSKIKKLDAILALNLEASSIRITGGLDESLVHIEVPRIDSSLVDLTVLANRINDSGYTLKSTEIIIGEDADGDVVVADLSVMPNLLMAGQTGSGKSVMLHGILSSLLNNPNNTPNNLKLVLIDPKRIEFTVYDKLTYMLSPVVDKRKGYVGLFQRLQEEVIERRELIEARQTSDIDEYNQTSDEVMPRIVVLIDEFSDLMMSNGQEIERIISNISKDHGVTGVHFVIATSRPSASVYTEDILDCFDQRIIFTVASELDSLHVLGEEGAEKLAGQGDSLFIADRNQTPERIQSGYISDDEVLKLVNELS